MSKRKNNRLGKAGITFYTYATERIREKRLAGKHNTADLYRTTRNWICAFLGRRNLFFPEITPGLISRFVAYLQSAGLRVNTVNTYLSNFRSIYNQACRDGLLPVCVVSPFAYLNLKRERAGFGVRDRLLYVRLFILRHAFRGYGSLDYGEPVWRGDRISA